jgi:chemotaxis protein MotB
MVAAWKVAYADFVTAMMAFFLVLWLVGQGKEVKAAVGGYFRDPSAFENPAGAGFFREALSSPSSASMPAGGRSDERERLERLPHASARPWRKVPAFKTLGDQVEFTVTPEGLRIDLLDRDNSSFFQVGSAVLRAETERILGVIAHEIGSLNHVIRG